MAYSAHKKRAQLKEQHILEAEITIYWCQTHISQFTQAKW
jgi:hypothetical protein